MNTKRELQSIYVSFKRVMIRLVRSKGRMFGTMFQPILFLVTFGLGFKGSGGAINFVLPGIIAMSSIMSSAMAGISVMWDREFGFLKEILVAPVSRTSIVMGRGFGAIATSLIQSIWITFLGILMGAKINLWGIFPALIFLILTSSIAVGLGLSFAAKMQDFESFQIVQNIVIMPLIFLSTAFIDLTSAPKWLGIIARVNPFSYGIDGLRHLLTSTGVMNIWLDFAVIMTFTFIATLISTKMFEKIQA